MIIDYKVSKNKTIKIVTFILFVFSFLNSVGLFIFLVFLMLTGVLNSINAIKSLGIITLRSVLNPGIAISISQFEYLKWIVLFACATKLIKSYFVLEERIILNKLIFPITLYLLYSAVSSFIFSTLPIVALMKIFSYGFIFIAILIGIRTSIREYDWINWMHKLLLSIVLFSIPFIFSSVGYLINGVAFQGITNQPNMFGIILVMFTAINITKLQTQKYKYPIIGHVLNILSIILIWMSRSRTSLISTAVILIVYLILSNIDLLKKGIFLTFTLLISIYLFFINTDLLYMIQEFLLKGADNLLYSRTGQVGSLLESVKVNPLFGTGFAVPVLPYRSYTVSTEFIVEPGNLILSVLAYGGFIGFILFTFYMLSIIWSNRQSFRELIYLPLATVMISMGEMVFFSSNSIGPWLYIFLAIYAFYENDKIYFDQELVL